MNYFYRRILINIYMFTTRGAISRVCHELLAWYGFAIGNRITALPSVEGEPPLVQKYYNQPQPHVLGNIR